MWTIGHIICKNYFTEVSMFGIFKNCDDDRRWKERTVILEEEAKAAALATPPTEAEEGTTYKVPYTTILDIQPHTNAERLELATVYGFQVIVSKGRYKVGDMAIYIPIDSILPVELEEKIFPKDSKVKLHHHRVRQI